MRKNHDVERVHNEARSWSVICVQCGEEFESTRSDATFCSSTCRSKYTRRQQGRQKTIDRAKEAVEKMLANMPRTGDSAEFDACNWIIRRISKAVNNVESK